jgi:hypothetical protein
VSRPIANLSHINNVLEQMLVDAGKLSDGMSNTQPEDVITASFSQTCNTFRSRCDNSQKRHASQKIRGASQACIA